MKNIKLTRFAVKVTANENTTSEEFITNNKKRKENFKYKLIVTNILNCWRAEIRWRRKMQIRRVDGEVFRVNKNSLELHTDQRLISNQVQNAYYKNVLTTRWYSMEMDESYTSTCSFHWWTVTFFYYYFKKLSLSGTFKNIFRLPSAARTVLWYKASLLSFSKVGISTRNCSFLKYVFSSTYTIQQKINPYFYLQNSNF